VLRFVLQDTIHSPLKRPSLFSFGLTLFLPAPTEISLILSDNGVGFDLSQKHASNGIGILSMKERARMLHGTFEIQSAPMKGTQITVKIPQKASHPAVDIKPLSA
jgi:two-component system sensor histidine kinase UhpB